MPRLRGSMIAAALVAAALLLPPPPAAAQETGAAAEDELAPVREIRERLHERLAAPVESLDVDLIMEGPDFSGTRPSSPRFSGDGERLWFEWKRWDERETGTWEYRIGDDLLRRLDEAEAEAVPSAAAVWDRDRRRALWGVRDRVLLHEPGSAGPRTVLDGLDGVRPVAFARDGAVAVVQHGADLLAVPLRPGADEPLLRRLTDVRPGSPPPEEPEAASQRWLREQQLSLFDTLERRESRRREDRARDRDLQPAPLYLEGWEMVAMEPSPDLQWVALVQRREASGDRVADVPDYVTVSGYTEVSPTRVKVGDELDASRVGVMHVASGRVGWADPGLGDRQVGVQGLEWSDDSGRVLAQLRSVDNEDRWFAVLTPGLEAPEGGDGGGEADEADDEAAAEPGAPEEASPAPLTIDTVLAAHDHDDAWINWSVAGGWGWLPGGDGFYFVSERSGWMHLYRGDAGGEAEPVALTSGRFEVFSPRLHPDRDRFVFEASIVDPFTVQAYSLPLEGGEPTPLTGGHGRQDVTLGPAGDRLAGIASDANRPWELYVGPVGGEATRVTESPSPAFGSYDWVGPEIVRFTARDGVRVPARLYRPAEPDPARPAVIFVHGAGYLQNVHRWWSSYSREYTFHHLLMERGYTVLDIDYRGSAGHGRDWRTAIHRHMGGKDLEDQVDGARWLAREHGVDPARIGIYGGSYGGFITLMALFTEAETFAAGAALRPVTDWAHYNHPYTSNILDEPHTDAEPYRRSSPIYFAEGLEDPLLIAHGVVDRNVHFQGVVRLAQRLVELRKEDWEVAMYPVEGHGFREPASWADEYRRILELFEGSLRR